MSEAITKLLSTADKVASRLEKQRGPWLGDGINPGINAYDTAKLLRELSAALSQAGQGGQGEVATVINPDPGVLDPLGSNLIDRVLPIGTKLYAAQQPAPVPAPAWEVTDELVRLVTDHLWGPLLRGVSYQEQTRNVLKAYREVLSLGQQPAPAPAPVASVDAEWIHHPFTPRKDEFDALYASLCGRPITIHEVARRCWKAAQQPAPAVPAGHISKIEVLRTVNALIKGGTLPESSMDLLRDLLSAAPKPEGFQS